MKEIFKKSFRKTVLVLLLSALLILSACEKVVNIPGVDGIKSKNIPRFGSCSALADSFKEARESGRGIGAFNKAEAMIASTTSGAIAKSASDAASYSETNVQVEGVDEADIVKTDGKYIYTLSRNNLVMARAYPAEDAEILSITDLDNLYPNELFIDDEMLLVFGNKNVEIEPPVYIKDKEAIRYYPRTMSVMSVELYDISDRKNPELVRDIEFEGNYQTSRKIGSDVYFVVNSYPRFYSEEVIEDEIVPKFRDTKSYEIRSADKGFETVARCGEIGYLPPINPRSFITVASISMEDENSEIEKETVVGSGENVYASLDNFYIAETTYDYSAIREAAGVATRGIIGPSIETTTVHKFALNDGEILYQGSGEVPGRVLNQFSMDEYRNNFRIATTIGHVSREGGESSNNIYVLDEDLGVVGKLEDLAPGERIYSARFMGDRGYLVTFKKVDPLFVIDLSDPSDPEVLGKLKIPGYSDYLHPYDEDHLIGIGKETIEAEEGDFAWYQGLKMAIFDVSDVNHPIELHKEVIGDRGTDSPVLYNHKAFLFDKERGLLVIPITLAEIQENAKRYGSAPAYGEFVFQGAYVYNINLRDGFKLRGRVTHFDDEEAFKKSGYYFYGGKYSIERSLYIGEVLYTISQGRIQLNSLRDLDTIDKLDIPVKEDYPGPIYY